MDSISGTRADIIGIKCITRENIPSTSEAVLQLSVSHVQLRPSHSLYISYILLDGVCFRDLESSPFSFLHCTAPKSPRSWRIAASPPLTWFSLVIYNLTHLSAAIRNSDSARHNFRKCRSGAPHPPKIKPNLWRPKTMISTAGHRKMTPPLLPHRRLAPSGFRDTFII